MVVVDGREMRDPWKTSRLRVVAVMEQRFTFNAIADQYSAVRPSYPDALIADVIAERSGLKPAQKILRNRLRHRIGDAAIRRDERADPRPRSGRADDRGRAQKLSPPIQMSVSP